MAASAVQRIVRAVADVPLNLYSYMFVLKDMAVFPKWFCQFVINFWNSFIRIWWRTRL